MLARYKFRRDDISFAIMAASFAESTQVSQNRHKFRGKYY